ncbi:MAG: fucose isomerase, partial [Bacilli bacterium]
MRKARIGVVCLTRKTYDYETAFSLYLSRCEEMEKDDSIEWKIYKENVIEPEDATKAIHYLLQEEVDAVIMVSGTFHLGHLALMINDALKKPILLWGFDELPYNGGKIRLNAVCGVNL